MARILVVDDSEMVLALMQKDLGAAGHEVFTAPNGKVGLKLFHQQPVDLILTDIYMPEGDGLELILSLRKSGTGMPPVIAMSSTTGITNMLNAAKVMGARFTLQKPFKKAELLDAVDSILGKPTVPAVV
jgi:DNA-binding response OmpR family regulator